MKDMLSKKAVMLEPSGIRKFFDIVSEMPEAMSRWAEAKGSMWLLGLS